MLSADSLEHVRSQHSAGPSALCVLRAIDPSVSKPSFGGCPFRRTRQNNVWADDCRACHQCLGRRRTRSLTHCKSSRKKDACGLDTLSCLVLVPTKQMLLSEISGYSVLVCSFELCAWLFDAVRELADLLSEAI